MVESSEVLIRDEDVLMLVNQNRGILWDRIAQFKDQLRQMSGAMEHKVGTPQSDQMKEVLPLKQTIDGGLYTREIFMPKGTVVVSFIHKKNHPSFFLSGEMSVLKDTGEIERIKAPMKIMTEIGTQRVAYMHEDCVWVCVYRTDKETFEEAEADVYADEYTSLPQTVITQKKALCLE